jgi:hypothetical protein
VQLLTGEALTRRGRLPVVLICRATTLALFIYCTCPLRDWQGTRPHFGFAIMDFGLGGAAISDRRSGVGVSRGSGFAPQDHRVWYGLVIHDMSCDGGVHTWLPAALRDRLTTSLRWRARTALRARDRSGSSPRRTEGANMIPTAQEGVARTPRLGSAVVLWEKAAHLKSEVCATLLADIDKEGCRRESSQGPADPPEPRRGSR